MIERLSEAMHAAQIPGLAFAILRGDALLCARGLGTTAVEAWGQPVTAETLFRIGSVTKPLTGTAILRLVEAGQLELDAPVTQYLPWLQLSDPGAAARITMRMLLTHTAGLPTDGADRGARDPEGLERFLRTRLPEYPLVAPPGLVYSYSNLGFSLLGHVAEAVTGQTYPDLMERLVFGPLGMERTTFDPNVAMTHPFSQSHRLTADGSLCAIRPFADNVAFAPAGFAYSTVLDLAKFARLLMGAGEPVLSATTLAEMRRCHIPTYSAGGGGRGLGLFTDPHPRSGLMRIGHMGGISGFSALLETYPEAGAAVILLMNRAGAIGTIRNILLEEGLGLPTTGWAPPSTEPDRLRWPSYTGTYLSQSDGLARVTQHDDALLLNWNGDLYPLSCSGPGHYVAPWRNGAHLGVGFLPETGYLMVAESAFRRVEPAGETHPETWQRYAGTYRLLQPPMTVRISGGDLCLHSAYYGEEVRCLPLSDTEFACKWGSFAFDVAPDGSVPGLRWGGARYIPRVLAI